MTREKLEEFMNGIAWIASYNAQHEKPFDHLLETLEELSDCSGIVVTYQDHGVYVEDNFYYLNEDAID